MQDNIELGREGGRRCCSGSSSSSIEEKEQEIEKRGGDGEGESKMTYSVKKTLHCCLDIHGASKTIEQIVETFFALPGKNGLLYRANQLPGV